MAKITETEVIHDNDHEKSKRTGAATECNRGLPMQSPDIKNRTARNSMFLIREGLRELRYYASQMADDPASIDRVIKESDLLSQTCKKLLSFVEAPEIKKAPRSIKKINMPHLKEVIAALSSGDICRTCRNPRDTE